ncbi:MAG TPA: BON domain-containing protein [Polyangia bacterium]|nr:BON domain-containing protein [Polyangia bacterium]
MRRILMALSAGTAGLLLAGTGRLAVADESSGGTAADTKQEQQIRATFQKTPDLRNDRIDVKVDDGIAVLEGTVDSQKEKKEAQQLAHVDGILGVNNRLQVRGAGK